MQRPSYLWFSLLSWAMVVNVSITNFFWVLPGVRSSCSEDLYSSMSSCKGEGPAGALQSQCFKDSNTTLSQRQCPQAMGAWDGGQRDAGGRVGFKECVLVRLCGATSKTFPAVC